MKQEILRAITDFDGKHTQPLADVSERLPSKEDVAFVVTLIIEQASKRVPTTWILKSWLELGLKLDEADSMRLIHVLISHDDWEARLHLLQSLEYLAIDPDIVEELEETLLEWAYGDATLIRAWSVYGIGIICARFPERRDGLEPVIDEALDDPTGSVRARAKRAQILIKPQV